MQTLTKSKEEKKEEKGEDDLAESPPKPKKKKKQTPKKVTLLRGGILWLCLCMYMWSCDNAAMVSQTLNVCVSVCVHVYTYCMRVCTLV